MNWDLIPEVFFDLIARVVPGSLFLAGLLTVHLGPKEFARVLVESLPSANTASLLLVLLLAYFAAIVLKVIWEFLTWTRREVATVISPRGKKRVSQTPSDSFLKIQRRSPSGATRLLKLQAEKNMCEVLVPGVTILLVSNAWRMHSDASDFRERTAIGIVLLISGLACWWWRSILETLYLQDLETLDGLSEEKRRDASGVRTS